MKRFLNILIIFTLIFSFMSPASAQGNKLEASRTSQKIILDGKEFELSTYTIDGKTYIKLRDFAKFLSTTSKKFSLSYDKDQKLPVIKTMVDYEDENLEDNKEEKPDAFLCEIEIIVNAQKIKISAANISGFIYLEIKDIAKLVGIEFSYNEENKTIEIKNASIIKDVNLTCSTKGCACKHKNKKSFNACPCCSGNNNSSNKGTSGESSGLPSCCARKKNNKSESSSSSHESSSIDHSKHTVKEVRYKCCEGCGCAHKTLDEYNACPCCMGKDPIAYEIDVEIASDEILARAKAKLNRANENLLRAQTEAKDAALNLQNAKNERTKAEEEKNKADQKLEEAKNKLASAIKAKEEADQRFANAVGEENKAKVLELMTKVEEAKKTKDEAENKLKEKTKELEQAKKNKDEADKKLKDIQDEYNDNMDRYNFLAKYGKFPSKNYNSGCGCHHNSLESALECPMCGNAKKIFVKDGDSISIIKFKCEDGCSCKHENPSDYKKCPCCNKDGKGLDYEEVKFDDIKTELENNKSKAENEQKDKEKAVTEADKIKGEAEKAKTEAENNLKKAEEEKNKELNKLNISDDNKKAADQALSDAKKAEEEKNKAEENKKAVESEKNEADKKLEVAKEKESKAEKDKNEADAKVKIAEKDQKDAKDEFEKEKNL